VYHRRIAAAGLSSTRALDATGLLRALNRRRIDVTI
jgi:hypothetical protein